MKTNRWTKKTKHEQLIQTKNRSRTNCSHLIVQNNRSALHLKIREQLHETEGILIQFLKMTPGELLLFLKLLHELGHALDLWKNVSVDLERLDELRNDKILEVYD